MDDINSLHARKIHNSSEIQTSSGTTVQSALDALISRDSAQQAQINTLLSTSIQGGSKTTISGAVASGATSITLSPSASGLFLPNEWLAFSGNNGGAAVQRITRVASGYTTGSTTLTLFDTLGQAFDASGILTSLDPGVVDALRKDYIQTGTSFYSDSLLERIVGNMFPAVLRNKIAYVIGEDNDGSPVIVSSDGHVASVTGFSSGGPAYFVDKYGKIATGTGITPYYGWDRSFTLGGTTSASFQYTIHDIQKSDGKGFQCAYSPGNSYVAGMSNYTVNPSSTGGFAFYNEVGASGTFSIVSDTDELLRVGLTGNVYKIDNSLGTGANYAYVQGDNFSTPTGSYMNVQILCRGSGSGVSYIYSNSIDSVAPNHRFQIPSNYKLVSCTSYGAASATSSFAIGAASGSVLYFTMLTVDVGQNGTWNVFQSPINTTSGQFEDVKVPFSFSQFANGAAIFARYRRLSKMQNVSLGQSASNYPIIRTGNPGFTYNDVGSPGNLSPGFIVYEVANGASPLWNLTVRPTTGTANASSFLPGGSTALATSGLHSLLINYSSDSTSGTLFDFWHGLTNENTQTHSKVSINVTGSYFGSGGVTQWGSGDCLKFSMGRFLYPIIVFREKLTDLESKILMKSFQYQELVEKNPDRRHVYGTSQFSSSTGTTINLTDRFGNLVAVNRTSDYSVRVIPTSTPSGDIGELAVSKGLQSFNIKNTGSNTTGQFDYVVSFRSTRQIGTEVAPVSQQFLYTLPQTTASLPTASAAYRGVIYLLIGVNPDPDKVYCCIQLGDGSYSWVQIG